MRCMLRTVVLVLASATIAAAQGNPDWHASFPAFKIAGNLYYVGTADLAVYLIRTPQGNIVINSDFPEDVPTIRKSIEQLGFKYSDTKIILISHAHGDHDGGVGVMQKETGARVMIMDADVAQVQSTAQGRPGAKVDRTLHDGDTVELGGSTLVAHLTPGHTLGCTTWTTTVRSKKRRYPSSVGRAQRTGRLRLRSVSLLPSARLRPRRCADRGRGSTPAYRRSPTRDR